MSTMTATFYAAQPPGNHEGLTVRRASFPGGTGVGSLTASSVMVAIKCPTDYYIVDGYISGHSGSAAFILKVGVAGTENNLVETLTFSATRVSARFNGAVMPLLVSISDDEMPRYSNIQAVVNGNTLTNTASIEIVAFLQRKGSLEG